MKIYNLGKGVYKYYKNKVKNNENITHELAMKKLTRNIMLSNKIQIDEDYTLCKYGYLHMYLKNDQTIVKIIANKCGEKFSKDEIRYKELNELLGITKKKYHPKDNKDEDAS